MKKLLSAAFAVYMTVLSVQAQECRMTRPDASLPVCVTQPSVYNVPADRIYNGQKDVIHFCKGIRYKKIDKMGLEFYERFLKIFPFDLDFYGLSKDWDLQQEYAQDREEAKKKSFIKTIGEFEKRFASEIENKELSEDGNYTLYKMKNLDLKVYGTLPEEIFKVKSADLKSANQASGVQTLILAKGVSIGADIKEFDRALGWSAEREEGFIIPGDDYSSSPENPTFFIIKFSEDCKISNIRILFRSYYDVETDTDERGVSWKEEFFGAYDK